MNGANRWKPTVELTGKNQMEEVNEWKTEWKSEDEVTGCTRDQEYH